MRSGKAIGAAMVAAFLFAASARAQIPGIPGAAAPVGGAATAVPVAAAPVAAAPRTIFGLFGITKANCAACKDKICKSQLGALLNNGMAPMRALSGGLIPQCCPTVPSAADIAALSAAGGPNGAEAVAAKIKADEADAKARRAAIAYLGTVDCHYWPDAEAALIAGLRADRNECVRYEAALALGRGCCCTKKTIAALEIVVEGSEADDNPSETSPRVRSAAFTALNSCLCKVKLPPTPPAPTESPAEVPDPIGARGAKTSASVILTAYYSKLEERTLAEVVASAKKTASAAAKRGPAPELAARMNTGQRSVYHALARARTAEPATPRASAPATATATGTGTATPPNAPIFLEDGSSAPSGDPTVHPAASRGAASPAAPAEDETDEPPLPPTVRPISSGRPQAPARAPTARLGTGRRSLTQIFRDSGPGR